MPFGHREDRLTASCYPSPVRRAKKRKSGQRGTAMADTHRRSRIQRMAGRPSPLLLGIAALSLAACGGGGGGARPSPTPAPPPATAPPPVPTPTTTPPPTGNFPTAKQHISHGRHSTQN